MTLAQLKEILYHFPDDAIVAIGIDETETEANSVSLEYRVYSDEIKQFINIKSV